MEREVRRVSVQFSESGCRLHCANIPARFAIFSSCREDSSSTPANFCVISERCSLAMAPSVPSFYVALQNLEDCTMWVLLLDLAIILIWIALTYSQPMPESRHSRWTHWQHR